MQGLAIFQLLLRADRRWEGLKGFLSAVIRLGDYEENDEHQSSQ